MTETTEENNSTPHDQFAELKIDTIMQTLAHESASFKDLAGIVRGLVDYTEFLIAQVTSLTKERDELKAEVDDLNYRAEEDERTIINHEKEIDALESQLSNREEEIKELKEAVKPAIDCLEAFLFAAGEDGANDLEFEFIVDTAIEYGCITKRKPTLPELSDPELYGLDADIGPDDEDLLCMRLPKLEALASLQSKSKEGEE